MRYKFERWFWSALDLIFPPRCCSCNKIGERWCQSCLAQVQILMPPYCQICGMEIKTNGICDKCLHDAPKITSLRSWAEFGGMIRKGIHQLKYKRNVALGNTFSQFLIQVLQTTNWEIDMITPVPLGVVRIKERGYNQSSLLARPIAQRLHITYKPNIIWRNRETKSQTKLNYQDRKANVAGAFLSRSELVLGKNILVVDDVATSGSTLEACADSLFKAGADKVYGITLGRAISQG